jgi:deoxyribonuclease V
VRELRITPLHNWNVTGREATEIQRELQKMLSIEERPLKPCVIAGVDVSFPRPDTGLAVVVLLGFASMEMIDYYYATLEITTPYIPGLLSFREGPVILKALEKVKDADLLFFDGHGIAHPRGIGIASHIGLFLDRPTIGVAKRLLYGETATPGPERGESTPILSKNGNTIGFSLRTRAGKNPVFVSPGTGLSVEQALAMTIKTTGEFKLPEPTRKAHIMTQKLKNQLCL